jgi:hypothetical protein
VTSVVGRNLELFFAVMVKIVNTSPVITGGPTQLLWKKILGKLTFLQSFEVNA